MAKKRISVQEAMSKAMHVVRHRAPRDEKYKKKYKRHKDQNEKGKENMYLIRIPERDNRENEEKVVFEEVIDNFQNL